MVIKADIVRDLVVANRILAHEAVVDSYGHVSVRDPERNDRFLLSRSVSPEQVQTDDVLTFDTRGEPVEATKTALYSERVIHAAIYRDRPDVHAVVHGHAQEVLPFTVTDVRLRPVLHVAAIIGADIPVWDMRDAFGDTDLLVTTMDHANDLSARLAQNRVVLMRGHGFTATGISLEHVVRTSYYLKVNARLQREASALGTITFLTQGEVDAAIARMGSMRATPRVWRNWAIRCGAGNLFSDEVAP
ncbi:Ribulose-5-phosphate 4-epimerase (plasmid) [Rhizobium rhizogenes K84]|uniref:Ribulose-5-phosphate 4-epimerase n=1 Tax=Rhizobium rhizogenes (strain K84 / ATCC BAA-868) TaxID=311403 RepID=B9JPV7_RHIR8|nr:Ribulose-5-phosphate 4-epimerase [Rhizobium rhizogenes K84]